METNETKKTPIYTIKLTNKTEKLWWVLYNICHAANCLIEDSVVRSLSHNKYTSFG